MSVSCVCVPKAVLCMFCGEVKAVCCVLRAVLGISGRSPSGI